MLYFQRWFVEKFSGIIPNGVYEGICGEISIVIPEENCRMNHRRFFFSNNPWRHLPLEIPVEISEWISDRFAKNPKNFLKYPLKIFKGNCWITFRINILRKFRMNPCMIFTMKKFVKLSLQELQKNHEFCGISRRIPEQYIPLKPVKIFFKNPCRKKRSSLYKL